MYSHEKTLKKFLLLKFSNSTDSHTLYCLGIWQLKASSHCTQLSYPTVGCLTFQLKHVLVNDAVQTVSNYRMR
jgi:hypothetical protein